MSPRTTRGFLTAAITITTKRGFPLLSSSFSSKSSSMAKEEITRQFPLLIMTSGGGESTGRRSPFQSAAQIHFLDRLSSSFSRFWTNMAATTVLESTLNSKGFLSSDEDSGFLAGATMALPQLMKALGTTSSTYTGSGCTIKKREAILAPLFLTRLTALHSSLFSKNNISASFSISNIRHVSIDSVWVSFGPPRIVNSSILLGARNLERINDNTLLREFKGYRILRSFSLEYAYKEDDDSSDEDQGPNVDRLQHAMTEGVVLAVDVELDCDVTSKLEQHQQQGKSASTTETTTTTTTTTTLLDKTESRLLRVRFETQNLKKRDMPDKAVWRVADVDNYLLTELADDLDAKISKIKPVVKGDE